MFGDYVRKIGATIFCALKTTTKLTESLTDIYMEYGNLSSHASEYEDCSLLECDTLYFDM